MGAGDEFFSVFLIKFFKIGLRTIGGAWAPNHERGQYKSRFFWVHLTGVFFRFFASVFNNISLEVKACGFFFCHWTSKLSSKTFINENIIINWAMPVVILSDIDTRWASACSLWKEDKHSTVGETYYKTKRAPWTVIRHDVFRKFVFMFSKRKK